MVPILEANTEYKQAVVGRWFKHQEEATGWTQIWASSPSESTFPPSCLTLVLIITMFMAGKLSKRLTREPLKEHLTVGSTSFQERWFDLLCSRKRIFEVLPELTAVHSGFSLAYSHLKDYEKSPSETLHPVLLGKEERVQSIFSFIIKVKFFPTWLKYLKLDILVHACCISSFSIAVI